MGDYCFQSLKERRVCRLNKICRPTNHKLLGFLKVNFSTFKSQTLKKGLHGAIATKSQSESNPSSIGYTIKIFVKLTFFFSLVVGTVLRKQMLAKTHYEKA